MPLAIVLEDITVIDYARLDPEAVVRGDSLIVDAELIGSVDTSSGFVMDFGRVKPLIKSTIDQALDHRLILATGDAALENGSVHYRGLTYDAPAASIAELHADRVTPEALARAIEALLANVLPPNVTNVRITTRHDQRYPNARFCYTHGLPHHDGNCQRLLHGHRGAFDVRFDGRDDAQLSQWLAQRFDGAHFAHARDVDGGKVAYVAPQGQFAAKLPTDRIVALNDEPSIEHIVRHAFETLIREKRLDAARVSVRANEGPRNGARYSGS